MVAREKVTRTPVRITGTTRPAYWGGLVGHEAVAYTGSPLLSRLVRLSDEAAADAPGLQHYVRVEEVDYVVIDAPTETVLL